MPELRRAVAHHHLRGHAQRRQRFAFERVGIDGLAASQVQLHVDECAGEILHGAEAFVERFRARYLRCQLCGHGLAGLHVARELVQHLGGGEPVFQQLRGELHVVAGHGGAGERRIVHVRRKPVQRMAEFVEQRLGIVPAHQQRLAGRALHEVRVVGNDGSDGAVELRLRTVGIHPGAGVLADARIRVEVPQAHVLAVGAQYFPHAHVGVVHGHAAGRYRLELEAE